MANVEPLHVHDFGNDSLGRYEAIGETLRTARVQRGLELEDVARELRIRRVYLQALEDGRPEDLPGAPYISGFLRTYADYLNLDSKLLVKQFAEEKIEPEAPQDLQFPEPQGEGRLPGIPVLVASVLLIGVIYGAWVMLQDGDEGAEIAIADVPAELSVETEESEMSIPDATTAQASTVETEAAMATGTAIETGSDEQIPSTNAADTSAEPDNAPDPAIATNQSSEPALPRETGNISALAAEAELGDSVIDAAADGLAVDQVVVPENAPESIDIEPNERSVVAAVSPAEPVIVGDQPTNAVPPPPDVLTLEDGRIYGQENAGARVVLIADADSWVQVQGRNNELVMSRILKAGDRYLVPDRGDLSLITGNAGGLRLEIDGVASQPLGPAGAVRRGIPLEPTALNAFLAAGG